MTVSPSSFFRAFRVPTQLLASMCSVWELVDSVLFVSVHFVWHRVWYSEGLVVLVANGWLVGFGEGCCPHEAEHTN
jgi:hypothetical protein